MTRQLSSIVASALILIGATKMALQAMHQETLLIPTCMGKTLSISVGASSWSGLHCWGCYAVTLGLVMFAGIYLTQSRADGGIG